MEEELLDAIDKLLARPGSAADARFTGSPYFVENPHPDVDLLNEELRSEGFVSYADVPPFRARRPYEKSLWVRMANNRCVPELHALASLEHGLLTRDPFWTDGDWTNNVGENTSVPVPAPPRVSKYGARSTTSEYRRKYYSDPENRARQRTAARTHAKKRREEERVAKGVVPVDALEELKRNILGPDGREGDDDDRAFGRESGESDVSVSKDENS